MRRNESHKYMMPKERLFDSTGTWFTDIEFPLSESFQRATGQDGIPDIRLQRLLIADEIAFANTSSRFFLSSVENGFTKTESDRQKFLQHLCFIASYSGILHSDEIHEILTSNILPPLQDKREYNPEYSRQNQIRLIRRLKEDGYMIIGFAGSFDPPTATHLANATSACQIASEWGRKAKIVFILDGDTLIQRKVNRNEPTRPRYSIHIRREILEPFWQTGATIISRVNDPNDISSYVEEYKELQLDAIALPVGTNMPQNEMVQLSKRIHTVRTAKLPVVWTEWSNFPVNAHSTDIVNVI